MISKWALIVSIFIGMGFGFFANTDQVVLCNVLIYFILSFWLIFIFIKGNYGLEAIPLLVLLIGTFAFNRGFSIMSIKIGNTRLFMTEILLISAVILIFCKNKIFNFGLTLSKDIAVVFFLYLMLGIVYLIKGLWSGNIFALRDIVICFYAILIPIVIIVFTSEEKYKLLLLTLIPSAIISIVLTINHNMFHFVPEELNMFTGKLKNFNLVLFQGFIAIYCTVFYLYIKRNRIIIGFFGLLCLVLIMLSSVRSSWVACIASFLFLFIINLKEWRKISSQYIFVFILAIALLIFLFVYIKPNLISEIKKRTIGLWSWDIGDCGGNVKFRWFVWKQTLEQGLAHPFWGAGFGIWPNYAIPGVVIINPSDIGPADYGIIPAHNYLLALFYKVGIIGLFMFLFINYRIFITGLRYLKKCNSEFNRRFLMATLASIIYWHGMALFFDVLESSPTNIFLWVLLGLVLSVVYADRNVNNFKKIVN